MRKIVPAEAFEAAAVQWIREKIDQVLRQAPQCHLMLAGGATPLSVYESLAKQLDMPWQRLVIYFGDERCVPPMSAENNAFMVACKLFPGGLPPGLTLHRMCGEEEPERAASDYESILPPHIDILLLGIGEDGHTASLFPGSVALDEQRRRVMPVIGSKAPRQRLTITPPVIRQARYLLMMARGEEKADAVSWALQEGSVPAALAADGDWLLDRQAARALLPSQAVDGASA
jgi:6-phosphogluconolactonase